MCLIRVGRVLQVKEKNALCDFEGVLKEVSCALFPKVKIGDDVVVSSGFISDIVKNKKELYKQVVFADALSQQILNEIHKYSKELTIYNISEINAYLIEKYSIKEFLPENIKLVNKSSNSEILEEESILVSKQSLTEILKEILHLLKA